MLARISACKYFPICPHDVLTRNQWPDSLIGVEGESHLALRICFLQLPIEVPPS